MDADILNAKQAAEFLGMHERTLKAHAAKGVLPGHKVGRQWRFSRVMLKRWFDRVGLETYDLVTRITAGDFYAAMTDILLWVRSQYPKSDAAVTLSPRAMSAMKRGIAWGLPAASSQSDIVLVNTPAGGVDVSAAAIHPAGVDFLLTVDTGYNKQIYVWGMMDGTLKGDD